VSRFSVSAMGPAYRRGDREARRHRERSPAW
jgi:hypothetical protein